MNEIALFVLFVAWAGPFWVLGAGYLGNQVFLWDYRYKAYPKPTRLYRSFLQPVAVHNDFHEAKKVGEVTVLIFRDHAATV